MEDPNRPRRDLKSLWLLPILAAGLWVLVGSWKKPPPPHPPGVGSVEQAKYDIYRQAKYVLVNQANQGQPKGFTVMGFAPYSEGAVTQVGPNQFRCESSLTVRASSGELKKERWRCLITGNQNNWACKSFQHTPPEKNTPENAMPGRAMPGEALKSKAE